ncbi:putative nuclease HARBI1 [Ambystoma mexicanum]|uniref:putative nuclease HARBI1 n=1 Tax=Ambystoma mexicanum TaxID=8296 RepID=UPI0037E73087
MSSAFAAYILARCKRATEKQPVQATVVNVQADLPHPRQRRCRPIKEHIYHTSVNLFNMSSEHVIHLYRLDADAILYLVELINGDLEGSTDKATAIPSFVKVLAVLYFCATRSYQGTLAIAAGMLQPSFCRFLQVVLPTLLQHISEFITFPRKAALLAAVKCGLLATAGFPNVVGAIDCTHVRIVPTCVREQMFTNQKMHCSLNIQMTCRADLQISKCYANFPGSAHDAFILHSSNLPVVICGLSADRSLLLGDRTYPLKLWIMTPILNAMTASEQKYNTAHIRIKNTIELTFDLLRSRFRCLHVSGGDLMYAPDKVCKIVVLYYMLHNLAIQHRLSEPADGISEEEDTVPIHNEEYGDDGLKVRSDVIAKCFM